MDDIIKFTAPKLVLFFDEDEDDNGRSIFTGHLGKVANDIISRLNISWEYQELEEYDMGGYNNGTWTGILGSVVTKAADIAIFPIPYFYIGHENVTYTYPVFISTWIILSGRPVYESKDEFAVFSIFEERVWMCLGMLLLAAPFVGAILEMISRRIRDTRTVRGKPFWTMFRDQLFVAFQLLLRQNGQLGARSSDRIFWYFYVFAVFCISSTFTVKLLSKLTLPPELHYFETLEQLQKYPDVKIFSMGNGPIDTLLKTDSSEAVVRLRKQFEALNSASDGSQMIEYLETIKQGKGVGIFDKSVVLECAVLFLTEDDGSECFIPDSVYEEQTLSFVINRKVNQRIADKFVRLCLLYMESRLFDKDIGVSVNLRQEVFFSGRVNDVSAEQPLELEDFKISLVIWFIGIFVASIAFCQLPNRRQIRSAISFLRRRATATKQRKRKRSPVDRNVLRRPRLRRPCSQIRQLQDASRHPVSRRLRRDLIDLGICTLPIVYE